MSQTPLTDQRHNEYVGSDATNSARIPGSEKATTGHHFIEIFPKESPPKDAQRRPEEHLPPSTGRDYPPGGIPLGGDNTFTERLTTINNIVDQQRQNQQHQPQQSQSQQPRPLDPAPDLRTVIDRDPFASPVTAGDTMAGATSKDVHDGIGHPGSGMSSFERHHDGGVKRGGGTDQFGGGQSIFRE